MMSDPIDDMLTEAGREWRAAQPEPPEPAIPRRSTTWFPVSAAAAAVVAAVSVTVWLVHKPAELTDPVAAGAAADLVVHDGDTVEGSGTLEKAGGQVHFCAPAPQPLGSPAGCRYFVPVTGVDVKPGDVHLAGVWRSGVLEVKQQSPAPNEPVDAGPPVNPPCAAPAGGWPESSDDRTALTTYIEQDHPDQFRTPWVASGNGGKVLVVEVVNGDVGRARTELAKRYPGNLCVSDQSGRPSLADQQKVASTVGRAVAKLMDNPANGIYLSATDDTVRPAMVMLTPQLYDKLADIGFVALQPDPWLRPV